MAKIFGRAPLDGIADAVVAGDADRLRRLLAKHPTVLRELPVESADLVCLAIETTKKGLNLLSPDGDIERVTRERRVCFDLLLENGASVTENGKHGLPVFVAAQAYDAGLLESLLARGADPNAKVRGLGWTAGHVIKQRQSRRPPELRSRDVAFLDVLRRHGATDV